MKLLKNCFEDLTEEDVAVLKEYFSGYEYGGAGYTFLANYIWRNTQQLCWEIIGKYLVTGGVDFALGESKVIISMPMTKDGWYDTESLRETILELKSRFDERNMPFTIELIPQSMVHFINEAFLGEMEFIHDRDADEYVYLKDKLINLSGRALHKKKNHLNYFKKTYEYEAKKITEDMIPEIMDFVKNARQGKTSEPEEIETLKMEEDAIFENLKFIDEPNVFSTAIFVDGKLEAFSLGEILSKDTAVAHFEKANDDFRGLYQVICSEFCKMLPKEILYVNREEDMGLENLRHSKESLKPHHMEEKYSGCFL